MRSVTSPGMLEHAAACAGQELSVPHTGLVADAAHCARCACSRRPGVAKAHMGHIRGPNLQLRRTLAVQATAQAHPVQQGGYGALGVCPGKRRGPKGEGGCTHTRLQPWPHQPAQVRMKQGEAQLRVFTVCAGLPTMHSWV